MIKIEPPKISILFFRIFPNLLPTYTPKKDRKNATTPIIIAGKKIEISRKEKLSPFVNHNV
jgi:hypothetical protein